MPLTLDQLLEVVAPNGPYATISITAEMAPVGNAAGKVAPPTFPTPAGQGGPQARYLIDKRWIDGQPREVVILDTEQSEANRCESELRDAADDGLVQLPMFVLTDEVSTDDGARQVRLTSLDFPHRYADAYLRDSLLDGVAFDKTEIGKSFRLADARNARALYEREPYSLVYGAWDSHRKGRQAKFPRLYDSTLIGFDPLGGFRAGGRLDPLNLQGGQAPTVDGWHFVADGDKKKGTKLSEIGHGNAMDSGEAPGQVAINGARRLATIHLAGLRGLRFGSDVSLEATLAARAALVALALLGDRLAFGRPAVYLRSGCELATRHEILALELPTGEVSEFTLALDDAVTLFRNAVDRAAELGIPMAQDRIELAPAPGLAKAIEFAFTKATGSDA